MRFPSDEKNDKEVEMAEQLESQVVEHKSISVQADHIPSKKKKKTKAADLSKRSIGVGSLCIDDTIEVSRAMLGSMGSKSSMRS